MPGIISLHHQALFLALSSCHPSRFHFWRGNAILVFMGITWFIYHYYIQFHPVSYSTMCICHIDFTYSPINSLKYIFICKFDSAIFIFQNINGQKYYTRKTYYIWFYIYTMMNILQCSSSLFEAESSGSTGILAQLS